MTTTWKIETKVIPEFFDDDRTKFFEEIIANKEDFLRDVFNKAFELFCTDKKIKKKIKYKSSDFLCSIIKINETDKIIYIELPPPKKCDFSYEFYVKSYFIPYRVEKNTIEIYDMFGVDTIKNKDVGFIVRYINSQHMMSNLPLPVNVHNRADLILFMSEYIFDRI